MPIIKPLLLLLLLVGSAIAAEMNAGVARLEITPPAKAHPPAFTIRCLQPCYC